MLTNAVQDLLEEGHAVQNAMQAMFAEMIALMSWNIFCGEYGIDVYTGQKWSNLYYTGGGGSGGARTGKDSENGIETSTQKSDENKEKKKDDDLSWMKTAKKEVGVKEVKGKENNDRIVEYHSKTSLMAKDDETAWCSSFINWVFFQIGTKGTNSAAAKTWASWGSELDFPIYGAIGYWVNSDGSGHVGFVTGSNSLGEIILLGGNQNDAVGYSAYPISKFSGFRYPSNTNFVYLWQLTLPSYNIFYRSRTR